MKVLINRHKLVVHLAQQVEQQQLHDNAADAVKKILKNLKTVTAIATWAHETTNKIQKNWSCNRIYNS